MDEVAEHEPKSYPPKTACGIATQVGHSLSTARIQPARETAFVLGVSVTKAMNAITFACILTMTAISVITFGCRSCDMNKDIRDAWIEMDRLDERVTQLERLYHDRASSGVRNSTEEGN